MIITRAHLVRTSNPAAYAWSGLSRFLHVDYVANRLIGINKLTEKHHANARKQAAQIRYCLTQAREYFRAAASVSIATKPNLLYYGTMSLALAEILFKQTGDSSLDRARQENRHHGLTFVDNLPQKSTRLALGDASKLLVAVPMEINGVRKGTFHLWHKTARESPITGKVTIRHVGGGGTDRNDIVLSAADEPLEEMPSSGINLNDCLVSLPAMIEYIESEGLSTLVGRGKAQGLVEEETSRHQTTLLFHPSHASEALFNSLYVPAWTINQVEISTIPHGFKFEFWQQEPQYSAPQVTLPHASMFNVDEFRFWVKNQCLNEFGFYYVSLFIVGNLARYYPDQWLNEVEQSTPLARAIEELCSLTENWVPLLCLSELSGELQVLRA